jgi:hypothetical protein
MRTARWASAGTAALLITLLASPSAAQYGGRQGAPYIRVYSQNGAGVVSNYVAPAIDVSENAYVFAVSMDLDGLIQVLHPDAPGISVRILQHRQLRLPNFFAGFSHQGGRTLDASGQYADYPDYSGDQNDSRGTVIALASRVPFNLERIESQDDWNISAIRNLIENRSPAMAAQALASYLGAKGEPIGRDYMRFASAQQNYYSSNAAYSCDAYYGVGRANVRFRRAEVLDRVARMQRSGKSARIVGYDFCGMPIVEFGSSETAVRFHPPTPRTDPDDKSTGGKRRAESETAALGRHLITRRAEPSQSDDMTATEPNESNGERRQVPLDRRFDPRGDGLPGTTGIPLDRPTPRHPETTFTGVEPTREYSRPVLQEAPRVIRETPPPPREAPARVERAPSPPPPRMEPSAPPPKKQ